MNTIKRVWCIVGVILVLICLVACTLATSTHVEEKEKITVQLTAPRNNYIEDFDTNLYKLWLEEQTGLQLEITWLPAEEAEQIVKQQLQTGQGLPDAYIGFGSFDVFSNSNLQRCGEQGVIIPLNQLIEKYGTNIKKVYKEMPEQNIQRLMTSGDGQMYFMPGFSFSTITRYRQIMWVNKGWLEAFDMSAPTNTDEFYNMLLAFKTMDPNGNGIADEIPMAGTEASYSKQPYDFIFNAFLYNDINNSHILIEDGIVGFAPMKDQWREAIKYMKQLANDSNDILGAFMSPGITFTVLQNSPEIMERYIGIEPLEGPAGVKLSTVFTPQPKPCGVITSACKYPEEVFKLFDLMLSEEASLMGRYGEQGVDWNFAKPEEKSIYGTPATIHIINQIWNTTQNKHLMQIVPYVSRPVYSGGVTWNGSKTDGEYMNAQAALLYKDYEPEEYVKMLLYKPEEEEQIKKIRADIEDYVNKTVIAFIVGEKNIWSDEEWEWMKVEFENLGLSEFLSVAQQAYDRGR